MNKEEIYNLLDKLDLDEWCTDLYKVPLTWCELYDIRDYLINLEQENKQLKEIIGKAVKMFESDEHFEDGCYCGEIEKLLKGEINNG